MSLLWQVGHHGPTVNKENPVMGKQSIERRTWLRHALMRLALPGLWTITPSMAVRAYSAVPSYSSADLEHARTLVAQAMQSSTAWRLVQELAVGIGPRPAGSDGDRRAVAWAQQSLSDLGLSRVRTQPIELNTWQRGTASAMLLGDENGQAPRDLVLASLGNSISTPGEGLEAAIAWYPSLAALMQEPADPALSKAAGCIVFVDQKTERTRDGSGYGRAVGARVNGPIEAARRGAVAYGLRSVGTSGDTPHGSPGSDAQRDRERIAHTGSTRYDLRVQPIPAFAVSVADADVIANRVARGQPLRLRLKMHNRTQVPGLTHNVLAEVPGTDLAQEVVLIGAHLDSWDLGQGAVDDGAGVAIVSAAAALIEQAARAQPALRPRRTIRVVLFANEENGFDGAVAYGHAHAREVHQLVAESDFGGGRIYRLASRVQPAALPLIAQMAQLLAPLGVAAGHNEASPGPDAAYLMRNHRWPALALSQDGTRYFDVHHTERDTIDQLDASDLQQNVACWAAMAFLAAQAPTSFNPLSSGQLRS
jgi:carboxypeptidase Q